MLAGLWALQKPLQEPKQTFGAQTIELRTSNRKWEASRQALRAQESNHMAEKAPKLRLDWGAPPKEEWLKVALRNATKPIWGCNFLAEIYT